MQQGGYGGGMVPQQQQQHQQQQGYTMMPPQQPTNADEIRTLWIGDLQYWMDENYLYTCFAHTGEVASVKVIRNKQTSQSEGYGFIEFTSRAGAERVLQSYNGTIMPNGGQNFRMNWASFSAGERRHDDSPDYSIFVGDLAADVTDYHLQETFRARYSSVKGAKVVIDRLTGRTKGYGFVKFGDESEQIRAMTEMQGVLCSTRAMRVGPASNKNPTTQPKAPYQNPQGAQNDNDPNNTTTQTDPNQWNGGGGYYGYGQGYENYGYAPPPPVGQDPNMYGSYPAGYGNYQPPQQQHQTGYS
ncbi:hypothetical protein TanjilG_26397 [Lupinus angustifolius]|uniref:RRM domain-containing protein n=1 Tax=Lupinus angustifolius TaxID=3871 RepID=A0A4P1R2N8_LUPAN|nr:hypothetical protein TanjilG_26397 [Lupinus angustifolius]